ncbi:putative ABC transporter ATP-binding/permease protein [Agrobacterium rubi TR3 = NBRC 13261]|uniref:Putative ABC transporter ATP-binding/permease protein n=1 Tax=Agrobacterium rubi TR3 = NBRC 13261 TaxID=1368415 RepID=A0A081CPZ8_9HYPH|nr:ABC transporter ATP-binding protein [Agrobacterium rubi]MBP1877455.1 ABC-type multidrug transport system fused ATPase/permease subunit [Agrobacterium rubi]MCL6651631.1 multidrug ABC transporter ATP-binding protein [Agrobacterium rubi]GAK68744.1 putative ABC transporter ATP-binding/permease protein [Agrobacterium rubi TR3 = NBRC 13261]
MAFSDFVYRPFEGLIRPLEIPYKPLPSQGPFHLLMHFVRMFRWPLIMVTVVVVCSELINLATVWGLSVIVDGVNAQGAAAFLQDRWPLLTVLGLLIFPVLPILIFCANTLSSQVVAVCLPVAIQWQGHKAVERQDLAFFQDLFAGQVASRLSQVASAVQQQGAVAFRAIPYYLVQFTGTLILLSAIAWPLAIPAFVWMVAVVTMSILVSPRFAKLSAKSARRRSLLVGTMADLYSNMQMVKQFAAEDSEAGALRRTFADAVKAQHRERRVYLSVDTAVVTLNVVLLLSMMAIGFRGMIGSFVTTGEFFAAVYLAQRLAANGRAFVEMGQQIFQAVGTIRDAMPVMTTPPTIVDAPSAGELIVERGEINFDGISFGYRMDKNVIEMLRLRVAAGEKVGLVGLSGAGKTTLVNLLLRFYELNEGDILIDGQSIRSVTQASLRENIGVISQDVSLLHRSVGDNIRYGKPGASDDAIVAAARAAQADQFIADLTDGEGRCGYKAFVGDRGVKLSGGQRQRVAIARVLLKDAPILILDEATSALDSESEAAIQEKLDVLMAGKTVIAIAHRLSTIAQMDRIIVLDKGRIVEEGTPTALLEQGGLYAQLWHRQTGGYIADKTE